MLVDVTYKIALYIMKLSQKHNMLDLTMTFDKNQNCKIMYVIYKNEDTYYIQLHSNPLAIKLKKRIHIIDHIFIQLVRTQTVNI